MIKWYLCLFCHCFDYGELMGVEGGLCCGWQRNMLDVHQRVDIPAQPKTTHSSLFQKRPEEDLS